MTLTFLDDIALLVLRLSGVLLAFRHGWGKVSAMSSGQGARLIQSAGELGFPAPEFFAWAAAISEFAGGILIAVGLGTRVAAAFAAFTMAVAAFGRHHAHQQFLSAIGGPKLSEETLKAFGNPELSFLFLLVLITIMLAGPGSFAIDHFLIPRRRRG
jgi:putative oxidoreductase